jgi:hypothetical protein
VTPRDHAQIGQFFRQLGLLGGDGVPQELTIKEAVAGLEQEDTFLR